MKSKATFDAVIVGQGLAGTALAWQLLARGQRVCVFDPDDAVTSSKIAAGLLTPVTGKNLALSPTFVAEMAEADRFYRDIERRTDAAFFRAGLAVRLFDHESARTKWHERARDPAVAVHLREIAPPDPALFVTPHGHFAMAAAQLDTAAYLAVSRRHFEVVSARLDWAKDVAFGAELITVGGRQTRWLISCEGYGAATASIWSGLTFRAAKGEILTLDLDRDLPQMTVHRGIWIAPTGLGRRVKVGATFSWDPLDQAPTATARTELETKLGTLLRVHWRVAAHHAAVRPIIGDGRPVVVRHPAHPRLVAFNGLAAKGALRAPLAAAALADEIAAAERAHA